MKTLLILTLLLAQMALAHTEGKEDLKPEAPVGGSSILQLRSIWKNQKGVSVNIAELRGKPRLVVMVFTRCETACPLIVEDIKRIAKEVEGENSKRAEVSIFSFDSSRETPESLTAFAMKRKLPAHWELYTADAEAVSELAAALGVRYKRLQNKDFIHSNTIFLLNSRGEVVAHKDGLNAPHEAFIKAIRKII